MNIDSSALSKFRATRAFIDLDAIATNVRALRGALPESTRLMAVVKADAYGHGAPWVADAALKAGASLLGVATVSEGRVLRERGICAPIVLLGSIDAGEVPAACEARLEITVADDRLLDAIQQAVRRSPQPDQVSVHLKVDTGLRRYGAMPEMALALAERITSDSLLRFSGLCTHFASADEPLESFSGEQVRVFQRVVSLLAAADIPVPQRHIANSAGILKGLSEDLEIARAGIALYGVPPSDDVSLLPGMRPAMRIESRVTRLIPIASGDTVGYNRTFRATRAATGALIPIGYADGYRRALAGRSWIGIGGQRAEVLGRISMDQIVAAIPPGVQAKVGDVVQVMGGAEELSAPSVSEMAQMLETNTYEVLVGIRQRVPRVFLQEGRVVAVRSLDATSTID